MAYAIAPKLVVIHMTRYSILTMNPIQVCVIDRFDYLCIVKCIELKFLSENVKSVWWSEYFIKHSTSSLLLLVCIYIAKLLFYCLFQFRSKLHLWSFSKVKTGLLYFYYYRHRNFVLMRLVPNVPTTYQTHFSLGN